MMTERVENISILGSTGSIGCSTLEVVRNFGQRFRVVGLAAGRNLELVSEQVKEFEPRIVSLDREEDAEKLRKRFPSQDMHVVCGQTGAEAVAQFERNDIVVSAITGINGLRPTLAAVRKGNRVALANKESMVVAGSLIRKEALKSKAQLIPVDSEHSGVFQCLAGEKRENVRKVILTASGGPFFCSSPEEMENKTVEEALAHPRWKMGKKVTIDSATLMNKGLELIEASWLFGLKPDQLGILIHPQSIVHSLVELKDSSVLAQLSPTDMKIPIQYALTYPERGDSMLPPLSLSEIRALEFFEVDEKKFPLVSLSYQALRKGGSYAVCLNAANEVVVDAFLKKAIPFSRISILVRAVVDGHKEQSVESLEEIFEVDRETRRETAKLIKQRS